MHSPFVRIKINYLSAPCPPCMAYYINNVFVRLDINTEDRTITARIIYYIADQKTGRLARTRRTRDQHPLLPSLLIDPYPSASVRPDLEKIIFTGLFF